MSEIELICRYLSNELNPKEKQQFMKWLASDSAAQEALDDYKKIWELSSMFWSDSVFDANIGWYNLKRMIEMAVPPKDEHNQTEVKEFPVQIKEFLKAQK
jgi:hypothetical protein